MIIALCSVLWLLLSPLADWMDFIFAFFIFGNVMQIGLWIIVFMLFFLSSFAVYCNRKQALLSLWGNSFQ